MQAKKFDLPTRAIHWALAVCVVLNLFVLESGDPPHKWLGYTACAAVVMRFIWGFVGGQGSRFRTFPVHLKSLVYFGVWGLVIGLGITGFMMGTDKYWGEEWLEDIHSKISDGVMILIGVHLLGVFIDSIRHRRKTWMNMVNGRSN